MPLSSGKRDQGGLRVFCSIGFGGHIIIGGGRFGHRIAYSTLGQVLGLDGMPTKNMIENIKTVPSALGSISALMTEQVMNYCESATGKHQDRFSINGMRDSELLWKYMVSLSPNQKSRPNKRNEFLRKLWHDSCREYRISPGLFLDYVSKFVEGDLREALLIASEKAPDLHPISMAIASIHSAEYFRESILLFAKSLGTSNGSPRTDDPTLLQVVKVTITAFATTGSLDVLFTSSLEEFLRHWKLYLCVTASLVKPDSSATSGGSAFLLRLGDLLISNGNVCGGHLCILLSGRRSSLDSVDSSDSLVSLLGANHRDTANFYRLLDPGPMHLSEIYEYITRLRSPDPNMSFFIPLQPWKFAYASMLACDLGFFEIAERYIQIINAFVRAVPTGKYSVHFRNGLRDLEMRLAMSKQRGGVPGTQSSVIGIGDVGQAALGAIWGGLSRIL